jgi:hypothetical protein
MKLIQLSSLKPQPSTDNVPTISSLKSEELWQFIEKPEGSDQSNSLADDFAEIWANAQEAADRASRGKGARRSFRLSWR